MKKNLYYINVQYRHSITEKWQYVYTHIVSSPKNINKIVKIIFDYNIKDDPNMQFKNIQYRKIKKASKIEKEMFKYNHEYLREINNTIIGSVPEMLMAFDDKKYEL